MHTPTEAADLWCPMVRIARYEVTEHRKPALSGMELVTEQHHIVAGCNTDALGRNRVPSSCRCISDKCAMWRWAPSVFLNIGTDALEMPGAGGCSIPAKGCCGLSGSLVAPRPTFTRTEPK